MTATRADEELFLALRDDVVERRKLAFRPL